MSMGRIGKLRIKNEEFLIFNSSFYIPESTVGGRGFLCATQNYEN